MALTQVSSAGIKNAEVKTEDILDANITTAKIAADAVTGAKIADDAIGAEHIEVLDANLQFADNARARFGTGNDLEVYHDVSNSFTINTTGNYLIKSGADVYIRTATNEDAIHCNTNAGVEVYYDQSKKFETTSTGTTTTGNATITGHIYQGDSDVHYFGDGPDLAIWHTGSHGFIRNTEGNLYIYSADGHDGHVVIQATYGEESIICEDNGAVKLYYDNSTKLETVSYGAKIYQDLDLIGDTPQIKFDDTTSSGYQSYINTNNNELKIMASAGGFGVYCGTDANGASNTTQRFWVNGAGLVRLPTDDSKLQIGASQDIEIYHNGTYSFIKNATGSLTLQSPGLIQLLNADASEYYIEAVENGAVSLYYDNGKVFETTASGAKVSGILECTSHVKLGDNDVFVAGAGDDLQIYHDGTYNWIDAVNNHPLIVRAGTSDLYLQGGNIYIGDEGANELFIKAVDNAQVELYYDNLKSLQTDAYGIGVYTNLGYSAVKLYSSSSTLRGWLYADDSNRIHLLDSQGHKVCMGKKDAEFSIYYDNAEKLRTASTGICVGRTNNSIDTSNFGIALNDNGNISCARDGGSNTSQFSCWGNAGGLAIYGDGNCYNTNNSYGQISDETLKQDIVDAGSQWDDIKNIKVRKFRFKDNASDPLQIGVVAQEIETVSPGLVSEIIPDENKPTEKVKTVKYSVLYMKAIKALQEAITKIETLETKVAALEAK